MPDKALLPTGLRDILPPDADFEAGVVHQLMSTFSSFGYERVKPPLIEFEDCLLSGSGQAVAAQTFRMMDPVSQRMMGVRPDITVQVGRIAVSRLKNAPRPLRLSYAGQVLRVKGSQLRAERQFGQAGIELIGSDLVSADVEVIQVAARSIEKLGIKDLSVDLGLPTLANILLDEYHLSDDQRSDLRAALDRKDAKVVSEIDAAAGAVFEKLLMAVGPAEQAIAALSKISFPEKAQAEIAQLLSAYDALRKQAPNLKVTIDLVENRSYEYHTGLCFTFFARSANGELGRGGRYIAGNGDGATGCTLFTDTIMRTAPKPQRLKRVLVSLQCGLEAIELLQQQGWVVVRALTTEVDLFKEASRINCSHVLDGDTVKPAMTE